jgi:hypothetical protein
MEIEMSTKFALAKGKSLFCAAVVAALSLAGRSAAASYSYYCVNTELWSVNWQNVGSEPNASRLAACSDQLLYALDVDKKLWKSTNGGAYGSWTYVTAPGSAASIACNTTDGSGLVVMNNDKSLWSQQISAYGDWEQWLFYGDHAYDAQVIGGGPGLLTAINFDQTIWTATGISGVGGGQWVGGLPFVSHGTVSTAARMSGSGTEFFIANYDGSLSQADTSWGWEFYSIPSPTSAKLIDIAVDATEASLFLLDASGNIWNAVPREVGGYSSAAACQAASY